MTSTGEHDGVLRESVMCWVPVFADRPVKFALKTLILFRHPFGFRPGAAFEYIFV